MSDEPEERSARVYFHGSRFEDGMERLVLIVDGPSEVVREVAAAVDSTVKEVLGIPDEERATEKSDTVRLLEMPVKAKKI